MSDKNNAGRLGAGFISLRLETRWLGHFGIFYVLEPPCKSCENEIKQTTPQHTPIRICFSLSQRIGHSVTAWLRVCVLQHNATNVSVCVRHFVVTVCNCTQWMCTQSHCHLV